MIDIGRLVKLGPHQRFYLEWFSTLHATPELKRIRWQVREFSPWANPLRAPEVGQIVQLHDTQFVTEKGIVVMVNDDGAIGPDFVELSRPSLYCWWIEGGWVQRLRDKKDQKIPVTFPEGGPWSMFPDETFQPIYAP